METKLYVGNIAFHTTEEGLKKHFESMGRVIEAVIVLDRLTGRSRGFGFVTMASPEDAKRALGLDRSLLDGRVLRVNQAEPRERGVGAFFEKNGRRGQRSFDGREREGWRQEGRKGSGRKW
ncbi:MAG: RNA-binding protein [Sandaracinaceae bacterium]|nr:RNA-binding protein [Sandaracinaceae bacterium]MDW8245037.1 RNA-binding protein [Sandaracinaceae bacterium]